MTVKKIVHQSDQIAVSFSYEGIEFIISRAKKTGKSRIIDLWRDLGSVEREVVTPKHLPLRPVGIGQSANVDIFHATAYHAP